MRYENSIYLVGANGIRPLYLRKKLGNESRFFYSASITSTLVRGLIAPLKAVLAANLIG
jgi:hypothetical protein